MYSLVYDSDCGPCTRFRNAVGFLDAKGRMEYMGLEEAEGAGKLDPVEKERRWASFHLVSPEGDVWSGASALPRVAALLPCGGPVSAFLGSRPVFPVASFVYSALSRLHDAGSCSFRPAGR